MADTPTEAIINRMARAIESGNGDPDRFVGIVTRTALRDARVAYAALRSSAPQEPDDDALITRMERFHDSLSVNRHYMTGQYCREIQRDIRALLDRLQAKAPETEESTMTDDQIKHMTERFLSWKLPDNFNPDDGISAVRPNYGPNVKWEPSGTNLFDYEQAKAMVRHMVEGLPST